MWGIRWHTAILYPKRLSLGSRKKNDIVDGSRKKNVWTHTEPQPQTTHKGNAQGDTRRWPVQL